MSLLCNLWLLQGCFGKRNVGWDKRSWFFSCFLYLLTDCCGTALACLTGHHFIFLTITYKFYCSSKRLGAYVLFGYDLFSWSSTKLSFLLKKNNLLIFLIIIRYEPHGLKGWFHPFFFKDNKLVGWISCSCENSLLVCFMKRMLSTRSVFFF